MRTSSVEAVIIPSGSLLMDGTVPEHDDGDYVFDGRFYQTVNEREYERRQNAIDSHISSRRLGVMGIGLYQQWVELDWKEPHGTHRAAERWTRKMREEAANESPDALYEYENSQADPVLRAHAIDELGDTLWVTCAIASNGGQSVDQALQSYLWGDGVISHREERLTLGHISKIIEDGFTPWFSPLDAIDPPENSLDLVKSDEMEPGKILSLRGLSLALVAEQQFAYGVENFFASYHAQVGKQKVSPLAAEQIMSIAWYAHHFASADLSEVIGANITKLRSRVDAGVIDKVDGDRSRFS